MGRAGSRVKGLLVRCVRHVVTGALADLGVGGFRYGARVVHRGVLVDQRLVAEAIRRGAADVAQRAPRGTDVAGVLRRITVRIEKAKPDESLAMAAKWSGGYRDRGFVDVVAAEGYIEGVLAGVIALLEAELGVPSRPRNPA